MWWLTSTTHSLPSGEPVKAKLPDLVTTSQGRARRITKEATLLNAAITYAEECVAMVLTSLDADEHVSLQNVDAETVLGELFRKRGFGAVALITALFGAKYSPEAATYGTSWSSLYAGQLATCSHVLLCHVQHFLCG